MEKKKEGFALSYFGLVSPRKPRDALRGGHPEQSIHQQHEREYQRTKAKAGVRLMLQLYFGHHVTAHDAVTPCAVTPPRPHGAPVSHPVDADEKSAFLPAKTHVKSFPRFFFFLVPPT